MAKPRLLDACCGAGGATRGYQLAQFETVGIDHKPQPRYPGEDFIQGDILELLARLAAGQRIGPSQAGRYYSAVDFAAVHASFPCQAFSRTQKLRGREHPDLVTPGRALLERIGLPYVMENVPGAPLRDPVVLEGQMFDGLRTQRTRWFETNWPLDVPFLRSPRPAPNAKMGRRPKPHEWVHVVGNCNGIERCKDAMGIDWMTRDELAQAIPPAYAEYIGYYLMAAVTNR